MADDRSVTIPMNVASNRPVRMSVAPVREVRGLDGVSPEVEIQDITGGHRIVIRTRTGRSIST